MKFAKLFLIAVSLFACFFSLNLFAFSVKPLDLSQITNLSQRIFKGVVLETVIENDAEESGFVVQYITFRVEECLKGACGATETIKQAMGLKGIPAYEKGKSYLLFFPADSDRTGLTSPMGLWQGVYALEKKGGRWLAKKGTLPDQDYEQLKKQVLQWIREGQ